MKKVSYIVIRVYQIALIFIFIDSFTEAMRLGNESAVVEGGYPLMRMEDIQSPDIIHGVAITSGYNGGALGMSILSACCLFLITFMELKLYQQQFIVSRENVAHEQVSSAKAD